MRLVIASCSLFYVATEVVVHMFWLAWDMQLPSSPVAPVLVPTTLHLNCLTNIHQNLAHLNHRVVEKGSHHVEGGRWWFLEPKAQVSSARAENIDYR